MAVNISVLRQDQKFVTESIMIVMERLTELTPTLSRWEETPVRPRELVREVVLLVKVPADGCVLTAWTWNSKNVRPQLTVIMERSHVRIRSVRALSPMMRPAVITKTMIVMG